MDKLTLWRRYKDHLVTCDSVGMTLDISRIDFDDTFFERMAPAMEKAYAAMDALENGAIANPDENRMVGHYWLRDSRLAPNDEIAAQVDSTKQAVVDFAKAVHSGDIKPPTAAKFTDLLMIGIGGSALGPQLVADALGAKKDKMAVHFLDNTDPDGFDRVLNQLASKLKSTLVVVTSKSGGTPEARNGMIEAQTAYARKKLDFAKHAVAVTGEGSKLDQVAVSENWITRIPMFDWVGGRTSVMASVGLLPAALQGLDIEAFLRGATDMDKCTRVHDTTHNPAAKLALMWYHATGNGKGEKDMVILPYKDRLLLMSRYLQQLVMESLGKKHDLDGNVVRQGIAVYGNKGSTDQHAYVQQLRDGVNNFFATFITVLQDQTPQMAKHRPEVDPGVTSGDYLWGFWQGTREALYEEGRGSILITFDKLDAVTVGALIALYERAVGFYATLVNVNAYHQPGVEAGKKAAAAVLDVQHKAVEFLKNNSGTFTAEKIADKIGSPQDAETIYHTLEHLAANKRGVGKSRGKYKGK